VSISGTVRAKPPSIARKSQRCTQAGICGMPKTRNSIRLTPLPATGSSPVRTSNVRKAHSSALATSPSRSYRNQIAAAAGEAMCARGAS